MSDYRITSTQVQDIPSIDSAGQPIVLKRVTYTIGKQGPFVLTYAPGQYTPERVAKDMADEVAALQALYDAQKQIGS